ncbi:hypothetical protein SADUNF_Sadunf15G0023400 [Salix dunnii]|uniref:Uncharacterized protein n=1 Tax=Salix dunnii TaxID=1413687 RepID=A0A835JDJ2_9ROSI|nr:hypothetical protein SADUNF_Sadunf15G0023400 [Salix dunnii]
MEISCTPFLILELKMYGQWMSGGQRRHSQVANPTNHLSNVGNTVGTAFLVSVTFTCKSTTYLLNLQVFIVMVGIHFFYDGSCNCDHQCTNQDIAIAISRRKPRQHHQRKWFPVRRGSSDEKEIEHYLKFTKTDGKDIESSLDPTTSSSNRSH